MSFLTDENVFQKCLNASLARKPFFSEICSDRATDNDDDDDDNNNDDNDNDDNNDDDNDNNDDDNDDDDDNVDNNNDDDDDNDADADDSDADDNGVKKTRSVSFSFEKKNFFFKHEVCLKISTCHFLVLACLCQRAMAVVWWLAWSAGFEFEFSCLPSIPREPAILVCLVSGHKKNNLNKEKCL